MVPQMVVGEREQEGGVRAQLRVRIAFGQRVERLHRIGEQTVGEGVGASLIEFAGILSGSRQGQRQEQGPPAGRA